MKEREATFWKFRSEEYLKIVESTEHWKRLLQEPSLLPEWIL